jgi:RNA polymerase sigma-70 factor (ECF subfamily)
VAVSRFEAYSPTQVAELIIRARQGSSEAVGELMAFSRQYLLLIANDELPADLLGKEAPSDLVQETHLEAARDWEAFRGHTVGELLGWLREILLHNVKDLRRRSNAAVRRPPNQELSLSSDQSGADLAAQLVSHDSSPSNRLQCQEQLLNIERALGQLAEDHRNVVIWRNRDGCSFEEIGRRLGRSAGAARKLWSRAIQQLQERLVSEV